MKTKFFKTGLPIMAFLMAIGLAFATEKISTQTESLLIGYIHENGKCIERTVNCNPFGNGLCKLGSVQVYEGSLTSCPYQMRDWQ